MRLPLKAVYCLAMVIWAAVPATLLASMGLADRVMGTESVMRFRPVIDGPMASLIAWMLYVPTEHVLLDRLSQITPHYDWIILVANCAFWAAVITLAVWITRRVRSARERLATASP
jgi:hypothetical protein